MVNTKNNSKQNPKETCPLLDGVGAYESDDDEDDKDAASTATTSTSTTSTTTAVDCTTATTKTKSASTIFDKHDIGGVTRAARRPSESWQNQLRTHGHSKSTKYVTWSWRLLRRKQCLALLGVALLILYVNSTLVKDDTDERIPVVHYSHVPGMKDVTTEASQVSVADTNNMVLPQNSDNISTSATDASRKMQTVITSNINDHDVDEARKLTKSQPLIASSNASSASVTVTAANFASAVNLTANATENVASKQISHTTSSSTSSSSVLIPNATAVVTNTNINTAVNGLMTNSTPSGYLVWSERCKMPNIDPYQPEIMKFFKREKYKPCSTKKPLTRVTYDEEAKQYVLRINEDSISSYSKSGVMDCCFQSIERNSTGVNADKDVSLSECMSFKKKTKLAPTIDNILVKCHVKKKEVYINGHAMMPERHEIRERLDMWKRKDNNNKTNSNQQQRPPSVLMIGIDSISRINLIRAMPKTAQYLYDNEWFEMSGYNKIDDNTFPNLMAVLTGRNKTNAFSKCPPTVLHGLDNCPFIWHTFRDHGYVTAYAEDEASINTFNYLKVGFEKQPVDFYLRPFLLSAEKHLHVKRKSNLIYCLGYQHSAEFIYDYAVELASRFKNDPFFGLFWTNTFSHNAISDCSSMDERMVVYLKKFAALNTLNNTIVIFFSDHGMRFGPTRKTLSGHLEERLPFMFIWLPQSLKQAHPEFVNALSVNKNRLTNPYDLHMTLKHVLAMTNRVTNKELLHPAEDCARCQTLLEPVPHNRSCDDIAIEDHWCTCIPYQSIYKNSKTVHKLTKLTIDYINDYVTHFHNGSLANLCVPLQFNNVENAYRAQQLPHQQHGDNSSVETYRIIFHTKPNKALFEATVRYSAVTDAFEITGEISRLNSYSTDSACMEDGGAKKYCSCRKKKIF